MKRLFAAMLAFSCTVSFAQTKLSVDDAVALAKESNVSIARNEITLDALRRAESHSWNSASPSVSVGAQSSVPVGALSDSDAGYTAALSVSASVSLSLSANLYTSIKSAKLNYEMGKISFDEAVRGVELSVRQTFYGLLYEKENIALQESNLQNARRQYDSNLQKYNSGRLSEIDVLSAEVSWKSAIPTVESARTAYQNDMASFKRLLGIDLDEEVELVGSLDVFGNMKGISLDDVDIRSAEIETLEKKIEAARISVLDKRFSAYAPSLSLAFKLSDGNWYVGADNAKDAEKSASLTVSATIPLDGVLPWSAKSDAIESAKDSLRDYELQLADAKTALRLSVDSYVRSINQSLSSIKSKQANVKLAQRSYAMTQDAYNRGTKDLTSLQSANSSLLSAQVSLKSEIYSLAKTVMNLENAIGVPFGTFVGE